MRLAGELNLGLLRGFRTNHDIMACQPWLAWIAAIIKLGLQITRFSPLPAKT
jgi:hypothetical protein